jgi:RNA polymerase sigma-70 factor (ECF subfamily)
MFSRSIPATDNRLMTLGEAFDSIVAGAREGGEWAWSRLYRDLAGPVLGYLRVRGAADPEAVLGETFLRIARSLRTFEGNEQQFRSWVFVIAHRLLLDERRTRSRHPEAPDPVAGSDRASPDDVPTAVLDRLGTESVVRLLETLTPEQRDVLALRIIGGLTVTETAEAIGKRPGAVKALQRRGLAAIRRRIERSGVPL